MGLLSRAARATRGLAKRAEGTLADQQDGYRFFTTPNTQVNIRPGDEGERIVNWMLPEEPVGASITQRAGLQREGIGAAWDAIQQDAVEYANAAYRVRATNPALARRYKQLAEQNAEQFGYSLREMPDGSLRLEPNGS